MSDITSSQVRMFRLFTEEMRGDRLAIDALLATVAGDDLPSAIARLEEAQANLPERKDGRKGASRVWNDLVERTGEMLVTALDDLRALEKREAEVRKMDEKGPKS